MSVVTLVLGGGIGIIAILLGVIIRKRTPKKLKVEWFTKKWKELQIFCKDKKTWSEALIEADKLLDTALKRRRFKGKSMGERLVSAQRKFSNNDSLWFAHNLCKKAAADTNLRLKEADVKVALIAFRQALKDLGAISNGESKDA